MKKLALIAALPLALSIAACSDSTPEAADGHMTAAQATDDMMAADTSAVGPTDTTPADPTATMSAKQLDTTAENLEERADRVEDVNEAEADRLEAQARAMQDARDAKK